MQERIEAWLQARDAARFQSDMNKSARSVRGVGSAAKEANTNADLLSRTSGGMMSVLRGVGRVARWTGIGLGLAGAAAGKMGFGFNKMIDSQRVAFTVLLRSRREAAKFMKQIRQLAFESPVLDPETTGNAARTLMAYGLRVKDTLPFVKALGDMSAATGKSIQEVMPRGAMAIGQIGSKGKLQTEELNQLAESVGLSRKRIAKELGMTKAEFAATFRPGENLSAEKALPAILKAMEHQAGGAAKKLSKTTSGRFDQFREMLKMKLGGMTRPLWNAAGKLMNGLTKRLMDFKPRKVVKNVSQVGRGFMAGLKGKSESERGGFTGASGVAGDIGSGLAKAAPKVMGAVKVIWKGLKTVGKAAFEGGKMLVDAFAPALPFFKNIVGPLLLGFAKGALGGVVALFKIAVPVIKLFATVLGWIGTKLAFLKPVMEGIGTVLGFVFGPSLLGKALGLLRGLASTASGPVSTALRIMWRGLKLVWEGLSPLRRLIGWVGDKFFWFIKGPVVAFRYFVSSLTKRWLPAIKSGFKVVFGGLGGIVSGAFNGVVDFITARINNIIDVINFALKAYNKIPGIIRPTDKIGLVGHIGGGGGGAPAKPGANFQERLSTNRANVESHGIRNPKGNRQTNRETVKAHGIRSSRRSVTPIKPPTAATSSTGGGGETRVTKVYIGRKQVAEAVADETDDTLARK